MINSGQGHRVSSDYIIVKKGGAKGKEKKEDMFSIILKHGTLFMQNILASNGILSLLNIPFQKMLRN